jgi:hypothetical protein
MPMARSAYREFSPRCPYCLDLIGGPYVETRESAVKAFRPKSAIRKPDQL